MPDYIVQAGDTLSGIARRFKLSSWRTLYDAPENAAFRKRRPNPNLIFPGDVIAVPELAAAAPPPREPGPVTTEFLLAATLSARLRRVTGLV